VTVRAVAFVRASRPLTSLATKRAWGRAAWTRGLIVLAAVAVIVSALVLFAEYRPATKCTHGISSAGPVTIVGGKAKVEQKPYTRACLS